MTTRNEGTQHKDHSIGEPHPTFNTENRRAKQTPLSQRDTQLQQADEESTTNNAQALHRDPGKPHRWKTRQFRHYLWVQGMVFAIEEINRSKTLLPNISLGFAIYASCDMAERAIKGTMWMVTGQEEAIPNYRCQKQFPFAAVIGDAPSSMSIPIARILGLYGYPQISYASTVSLLSDKHEFPSFFRTIPSDEFQSIGLARLAKHFGWTWVGLLAGDNDYSQQGIQSVRQEIINAGGCIAFSETLPLIYSQKVTLYIVDVIKKSKANTIVVFGNEAHVIPLMEEIVRQNIIGKVWIASDGWYPLQIFSENELLKTLIGTFGIWSQKYDIPGFHEFLYSSHPLKSPQDIFIKHFWEESFGCKWLDTNDSQTANNELSKDTKLCTGKEKMDEMSNILVDNPHLIITYNIYNAVYAVAHALHDLYSCKTGKGPFANGMCANIYNFEPWQLLHYVKNVRFKNSVGAEVFFDRNGNPPPVYDILNWQLNPDGSMGFVKVGSIDFSASQGKDLLINENAIMWNGGDAQLSFLFLESF
ncbi:extracellular calcium-sensing receptor-like [Latimeria chalumnae]|uniref:extracellular calcium-sensing receptor-like n=1 Tax=Latimeria chalumnae TaxID=7897 RepID=UPI00313CC97F